MQKIINKKNSLIRKNQIRYNYLQLVSFKTKILQHSWVLEYNDIRNLVRSRIHPSETIIVFTFDVNSNWNSYYVELYTQKRSTFKRKLKIIVFSLFTISR